MNNFEKTELIGRKKFESILKQAQIKDYHFTEDEYDSVDCYYSKADKTTEVEIKVRSQLWDTLFMEVSKYKRMKQIIKDGEADKGLYVNFIGNRCYIFPLSKITSKNGCTTSYVYSNRTTAVNTGKKQKLMIEIPVKLATVFEYKEDRWAKC